MTAISENVNAADQSAGSIGQPLGGPVRLEDCLDAYQQTSAEFGFAPICRPGKWQVLGWDLEYVCAPAIMNFIDQLLVRRLNDFIPDNDQPLILDCGANIGFSVLNFKRQFPRASIIAFEPDPQFAPVLRRNLERNGAADVQVVQAAVWVKDGEARWLCEGIDGSKIMTQDQDAPSTVVVRTVDLADYLSNEIDLLKIDIEGAEYELIEHVGDKLRTVKNMSIECHLDQTKVRPFAKMLETLVDAGFEVGINSFGAWRDLIRQTPILPHHWGQYLVVSAWRGPLPTDACYDQLLPYAGIQQLLTNAQMQTTQEHLQTTQCHLRTTEGQLRATQSELQATQSQLQATQSQLQATQSQLQATQSQLQATQSQLQATLDTRDAIQSDLHTMQAELQATQVHLHAAQSELKHYQSSRLIRLAEKLRRRLRSSGLIDMVDTLTGRRG